MTYQDKTCGQDGAEGALSLSFIRVNLSRKAQMECSPQKRAIK